MSEVILYVFAGRRENLELQLPFIRRVLDEHPEVSVDIWNLTKLFRDAEYVRHIKTSSRLRVRNDFYRIKPWWKRFDHVWKHYAQPQYADTFFVKLDDDVVFFETNRFSDFLMTARLSQGTISSALTINNGASVAHTPGMAQRFDKLDMPLLDVHEHGSFAQFSHDYAIRHWDALLGMPVQAVPTEDWVSINMIAYDWAAGFMVASMLGSQPGGTIAGRDFALGNVVGDEGACNMVSRQIIKGFLAVHLTFGPQVLPKETWAAYRKQYGELGRRYLVG